ncbi:site-specific recombinase XerD [Salibacterium salarium]|uniref:tyrosine-type recombinase/integrase n=1 Tax=Salibacterium salarium TaxID=284579 RepID=UPI00278AAAB3|nr:tyrosine-type recombinase/integrase [Salibacterium salarium]MDQ0300412.1 site-specific recombinase XerD [Salibacterium salarium]
MLKKGKRPAKRYRTKYDSISKRVRFSFSNLCDIYLNAKQAEWLFGKYDAIETMGHSLISEPLRGNRATEEARNYVNYLRNEHVKHANNSYVKDRYKTSGMSIGGVNTHLSVLRAMFQFLYEEKYLDHNPFKRVKMLKEPTDQVEALTLQQARRLIKEPDRRSYSDFRDAVLFTLMLDCGLRLGEAVQLQINDIDFTANTIYISGGNAKGNKGRFVPFSQRTSRLLRELRV